MTDAAKQREMIERFSARVVRLRDSQGTPFADCKNIRVEVDFDALCDVLRFGPDLADALTETLNLHHSSTTPGEE